MEKLLSFEEELIAERKLLQSACVSVRFNHFRRSNPLLKSTTCMITAAATADYRSSVPCGLQSQIFASRLDLATYAV